MKQRFWLFQRGPIYYVEDSETGKKESFQTSDRKEAERLRSARNEAAGSPLLGVTLAKAYLSGSDPALAKRTWRLVMEEFCKHGKESSRQRRLRAINAPVFNSIRERKIFETRADDLRAVLADDKPSTNHFLRCLHNLAIGLGWLPWPIIPPKLWPEMKCRKKRGITADEQQRILEAEKNPERHRFYRLLWEIGSAQTDAALLETANIDWERRVLTYQRQKTGEWSNLMIGKRLELLLREFSKDGPLFPHLRTLTASARAAEFYRRCRILGIKGVSLHSYRYAWAQRAKAAGYPARWAQNALGHNSRAVHELYAKGAEAICPSLETYESKIIPLAALNSPAGVIPGESA